MSNPKEECMKRVIVLAALLAAVGSVAAEEQGGPGACRADAEKLCKGIEPGQGRIAQCLKEHEAQVSGDCKAHIAKMREQMQAFNEACKADVEKSCKGVEPGQGRMMGCLRKNEANLSAPCKEQIAKMDERREHMRERMHDAAEACKGDAQQYCAKVKPGGGRVVHCLKENEAKLSAPCKAAMQPK
jgi:Golgi apparatus protein 1